jgi:2-polyprenyl-3-methyl-5-hydroxy-6-metoxy-1,4-benzoquinol methylase
VVGVDRTKRYIEVAEKQADDENLEAAFIVADMRDIAATTALIL